MHAIRGQQLAIRWYIRYARLVCILLPCAGWLKLGPYSCIGRSCAALAAVVAFSMLVRNVVGKMTGGDKAWWCGWRQVFAYEYFATTKQNEMIAKPVKQNSVNIFGTHEPARRQKSMVDGAAAAPLSNNPSTGHLSKLIPPCPVRRNNIFSFALHALHFRSPT